MMTFTILGDPVPHVTVTYRGKWMPENARAKKVARYKENIRKIVMVRRLKIPVPSKDNPVLINTVAYFRNGRHGDPESIHKVVKDALWPAKEGGDKYTGGSYNVPLYDSENPRVEVEIYSTS